MIKYFKEIMRGVELVIIFIPFIIELLSLWVFLIVHSIKLIINFETLKYC